MRSRLAPTPSGFLHAGNVVNFLVIDAIARASGATLVLRIDDLDRSRVRSEYVSDIFTTLSGSVSNGMRGRRALRSSPRGLSTLGWTATALRVVRC